MDSGLPPPKFTTLISSLFKLKTTFKKVKLENSKSDLKIKTQSWSSVTKVKSTQLKVNVLILDSTLLRVFLLVIKSSVLFIMQVLKSQLDNKNKVQFLVD